MFLQGQFLLVNAHFTINLLAALVSFAVAWLYFDAWIGRKDAREATKWIGFLLLSISFVIHAAAIEQSLLDTSLLGSVSPILTGLFRVSAYLVLSVAQIIDPLQPLPEYRGGLGFGVRNKKKTAAFLLPLIGIPFDQGLSYLYPILAALTGFLYLRRATVGLEHHLKPISSSFFILSLSELAGVASTFRESDNIAISNLVSAFGPLWLMEHILFILSAFVLGKWVWGYLIKRLETQLLMIFTTMTLGIFLITTIFFTSTQMNSLQKSTLENMEVNVNVLQYTIDSKKAETLSDAQVIAQNPEMVAAVNENDKTKLTAIASSLLLTKKQAFLVIVSDTGAVLMRGDDPDKVGGSLSDDRLVKEALEGNTQAAVVTKDGVIAPEVSVRGAAPIKSGDKVIGAVILGTLIDNAFVDGLKEATGLDASVYADNIRSATTFVAPDGKSRWIGIKEETDEVKKNVLVDGVAYIGSVEILNVPYHAAFAPLKNIDNNPVGMLFVGRPQVTLLQSAGKSIELTFTVTVVLLIMSVVPAYLVSKYIIDQIH